MAALVVYTGTPDQHEGLRQVSQVWHEAGFWPLASIQEALATHGTALTFLPQPGTHKIWKAACLYRSAGPVADLLYIGVLPAFRRQGLAEVLLDDMVKRLRRQNCERLLLEVSPANRAAISLYQGFGMHQIAVRKRYYQNGDDALIFQLDLT